MYVQLSNDALYKNGSVCVHPFLHRVIVNSSPQLTIAENTLIHSILSYPFFVSTRWSGTIGSNTFYLLFPYSIHSPLVTLLCTVLGNVTNGLVTILLAPRHSR